MENDVLGFNLINLDIWAAGEWWKSDVEAVINQALSSGLAPNVSDAHTINGHPGPVSNCPSQGTCMYMHDHAWKLPT